MINKKTWRQAQIQRLHTHQEEIDQAAAPLITQLITSPFWAQAQTIATTVSGFGEVPTVKQLLSLGLCPNDKWFSYLILVPNTALSANLEFPNQLLTQQQ